MSDSMKNGAVSDLGLSSQPTSPKSAEFQFERPDWTLFRSADTLAQKAGVRKHLLRRLVLKVIPPSTFIVDEAERQLADQVEQRITARVLREARISDQVADALALIEMPEADVLAQTGTEWVGDHRGEAWSAGVAELAADLAGAVEL